MSIGLKGRKEPLIQIAVAPDELTANIWKDVLTHNGIETLLQSRNLAASIYLTSLKLEFGILVLKSNVEQAKQILEAFQQDEPLPNADT